MLALALLAQPLAAEPDGTRVRSATQCFAIVRDKAVVGATFQKIRRVRRAGRVYFDIVVHQRVSGGKFDLRDHFVLDGRTLRPISFDSRKSGEDHVELAYSGGRIVGWKLEKGARVDIDLADPDRVWEGNLWGVTFGALPLAAGGHYQLPLYQYDLGFGAFSLDVVGSEAVVVDGRSVDAWRVEGGTNPARRVTYLIAKRDGAELGTRAGPFETRLGGDCAGLS